MYVHRWLRICIISGPNRCSASGILIGSPINRVGWLAADTRHGSDWVAGRSPTLTVNLSSVHNDNMLMAVEAKTVQVPGGTALRFLKRPSSSACPSSVPRNVAYSVQTHRHRLLASPMYYMQLTSPGEAESSPPSFCSFASSAAPLRGCCLPAFVSSSCSSSCPEANLFLDASSG